jgi:MFS family permease
LGRPGSGKDTLVEHEPDSSPGAKKRSGGRVRRNDAAPLAAASSLVFSARGSLSLLIQLYLRELHASPLIISLATSTKWLGVIGGGPFWGTLSGRRPKRFLLFLILGTSAVAIGILVFLPPASGVLPSVFVRTFAVAGLTPIAMVIVAETGYAHRRGRNLSFISSSSTLGVMVGGAVAGFLLGACGFRWSFLALASLPLLALPLLLFLPRENRTGMAESGARTRGRWSPSGELKSLYLGVAFRQAAISGAGSLVFVFMASLEITPGVMGLLKALGLSVSSVGVLGFGWLADRMKRRPIFLFGFAIAGLSPLVFAFASNARGMAAGYVLLGTSFGSYYASSTTYITDVATSKNRGTMLGFLEASRGLGGVLGPLVAGTVTPVIGYRGMFLVMAGIATLGFLLVLASQDARSAQHDGLRGR